MKNLWKRLIWIGLAALLVTLLVRSFRRMPVLIDVATVTRNELVVTVDDDGRTRVRERYTISAPIDGRLLRTVLRPGDPVEASETLLAEFAPVTPRLLDARSRSEAEARIQRAEAALSEAEARSEQAAAEERFAGAELDRIRELARNRVESSGALDRAERDAARARAGARAARFAVQVNGFELELARASMVEEAPAGLAGDATRPEDELAQATWVGAVGRSASDGRLLLRSPVPGRVLRVFEESARTLLAGTPILEVGNTEVLEVVADYLSQDAVKVAPGMDVLIEGWGGDRTLRGTVRVIEPGGFTKTSALGVEEQRVNVIVDPRGDPTDWAALGDGYRVELRIVLWQEDDVLVVPTGALFREGAEWAVFVLANGRAEQRAVDIGRRNGLEAQVLGGLAEGDELVLYPSELIADGTAVERR